MFCSEITYLMFLQLNQRFAVIMCKVNEYTSDMDFLK